MRNRTLRKNIGQMRVIETILASLIILSALAFVNIFAATPTSPVYEVSDLEKMGYSIFHDLDQQGLLAPLVYNQDWSNLRAVLKITMPIDVYFNLTVCDLEGNRLNTNDILYGDSSTFEVSKNTASVSYALIGFPKKVAGSYNFVATYQPRILLLQISRG